MAVVVALSITVLTLVVIALGIRHAVKLRAYNTDVDDDLSPTTVTSPVEGPRISTVSTWSIDSDRSEDSAPLSVNSHS